MPLTKIAAAAAQVICTNNDTELNIDSRAAIGMSAAAAVMAFAATRTKLGFTPLLVASGLQAALFAGTLFMTVGRFNDCSERVNVYSPGNLWDEMSGVSSDTLDAPISAVVDVAKNPISHWVFSTLSSITFYFFGIPMNIRQLVFAVCSIALAAPVSGMAIASVGVVGFILAAMASAVYEFPIVTAARLVNATLIGPYVLAFHAVANVITWLSSLLPWLVDPYMAGMLIFTALCAVATIMLRCVVKLPHLHSLRTGILQQMFVLATQWVLQLPPWHPIWLTMLPVMHRTGNSDPPPSTTLRVLGARLAIPPAMAAAVGLHARGSKADAASEHSATAGASSIWRLVYSACLSITTVLGRGYLIMEAIRYFPWLLPSPARRLLASPGAASPTPGVEAFTGHLNSDWELMQTGSDGMLAPDAITHDIGSAAYYALQCLGSYVVVPMASLPGLAQMAAACSHRITVLQLALMHPAFASTLNGVARFLLGCAMCAFGAKWGRRVLGIRQGWLGMLPVLLLPCLIGVNLAYGYGLSMGESLVVSLGTSVFVAYLRMLPKCQGIIRQTAMHRAARRLNQQWSKHRLASELTGMVVVAIVVARVVLGGAASFFGAILVVREWPRALWWMRVILAGQTLALDAAPRLHHLSPALAGTLVTAVAALSVYWKVVCLQQQHRVRAPQYARAVAALLDWPSGTPPPYADFNEEAGALATDDDGSERLVEAAGAMDLYDIAETWSEGSVDLSVAADTPSPHAADEDTEGVGSPEAASEARGNRQHGVWWSDTGSEEVSSALGWWRRQQGAPSGVHVDGASEGGSSYGGILSSMSQLFEGVAMGQVAVGGFAAGLGGVSTTGSDPDPSMAQAGDPAYADSDGGTLVSGDAERETNSRSSGLPHYASQFHPLHGRRGTAADSGEIPDAVLDAAWRGGTIDTQTGDFWRNDHHFSKHQGSAVHAGGLVDDDDDTASVMSAATMGGTSRKEARRALRRRRHMRSRSTGRSNSGASRSPGVDLAAQRRARTSVGDDDCAPSASGIECDAPSALHQQMTPAMGPISSAWNSDLRDLDELSFARGHHSPAPWSGDAATISSGGGRQQPSFGTLGSQGYAYSPWGSTATGQAGAYTSGLQGAPHTSPHVRSMPPPAAAGTASGAGAGIAYGQAMHRGNFSEPIMQAGLGSVAMQAQAQSSGRPPRAEASAGAGRVLSVLAQTAASPQPHMAAPSSSARAEHSSALPPVGHGVPSLPGASSPQFFAQPSPLPPVTMDSESTARLSSLAQSAGAQVALPLSSSELPLRMRAPQGGMKRIRGHSADSDALDLDLTAHASNSRSMDSAATAPAGLMSTSHTPVLVPTPMPHNSTLGETAYKKPRPLQPTHTNAPDTAHSSKHLQPSVRQSAMSPSGGQLAAPPSVAPPAPPSSVAAAASISRLSTVPASMGLSTGASSYSMYDTLLQTSASVSAGVSQLPLLPSAASASISPAPAAAASDSEHSQVPSTASDNEAT